MSDKKFPPRTECDKCETFFPIRHFGENDEVLMAETSLRYIVKNTIKGRGLDLSPDEVEVELIEERKPFADARNNLECNYEGKLIVRFWLPKAEKEKA